MAQYGNKLVGIWIDHTNAWIVRYDKGIETIQRLESQIGPRVKETGGTRMTRVPHHKIEGHRHEQAKKFYQEIISKMGDVSDLLLMGPSSAKEELKTYLAKHKSLSEKVRDTIPADHMTERQIAARVRKFFNLGNELEATA
jgi:stalled ribosome rescue protein Dom34